MRKLAVGPWPLIAILALAVGLRTWGLGWGLPSDTHYVSYHPDETVVLAKAMAMDSLHGRLLPHYYNYGSLQLYLVNFANTLVYLCGGVTLPVNDLSTDWPQWARLTLVGRLLSVTMGVGTVWATAALGTRLYGRSAGLLGAALLAILPLHVQQSHWMTVDVPAAFWTTLALLAGARVGQTEEPSWRRAALAGVFVGLAAATKYNTAVVFLPVAAACVPAMARQPRRALAALCTAALCAAAAFFVACPGSLLEHAQFAADLSFERHHVFDQPGLTFQDTGNGFVYAVTRTLDAAMGLPLLAASLAGVGLCAHRRTRGDALLASFALPYYVLIGVAAVRYARYVMPLLPVLAIWAGRMLAEWSAGAGVLARRTGPPAAAATFLCTAAYTVWLILPMTRVDTRDQALAWLRDRAPLPLAVGFPAMPWFQTAPVSPYFPLPARGGWRQATPPDVAAEIRYNGRDWDQSLLGAGGAPTVVVSEYDAMDAFRVGLPEALRFRKALDQGYRLSAGFGSRRPPPGVFGRDLPHDMLYPGPEIQIWTSFRQRKSLVR